MPDAPRMDIEDLIILAKANGDLMEELSGETMTATDKIDQWKLSGRNEDECYESCLPCCSCGGMFPEDELIPYQYTPASQIAAVAIGIIEKANEETGYRCIDCEREARKEKGE